jgi:hypothetical protein
MGKLFNLRYLDEEARRRWMKQEFPKILKQAKRLGAPVYFGDEASFALWVHCPTPGGAKDIKHRSRPQAYAKATKYLAPLNSLADV